MEPELLEDRLRPTDGRGAKQTDAQRTTRTGRGTGVSASSRDGTSFRLVTTGLIAAPLRQGGLANHPRQVAREGPSFGSVRERRVDLAESLDRDRDRVAGRDPARLHDAPEQDELPRV